MMSENRENNSLSFPVPDGTEHDHGDPSHPTTRYNVAVEKESNGVTVTAEVTASAGSHESGSQGSSETSDSTRRAPDRQSAISSDSPQPPVAAPQHEIQHQFDVSSSSRLSVEATTCHSDAIMVTGRSPLPEGPFTNVSECKPKPTPQCAPSTVTLPKEVPELRNDVTSPPLPPPSSPQQHKIRQALNLSAEEQKVPNSPSLPGPVQAEKTGHRDAMVTGRSDQPEKPFTNIELGAFSGLDNFLPPPIDESAGSHHPSEDPPLYSSSEEVDAADYVQTLISPLEQSHLTPNERDQKYIERRDYNVSRVVGIGGQGVCSLIGDVTTRALAVQKASKSENDEDCLRECKMLSKLRHIPFFGAVREKATVKLPLQHAPYGTFRELFRGKECFQPPARMSYFLKHTIHGMSYLHQHGIIHGAINGDNVAVYLNGQCKLTNFDQAIPVKDVWKEREKKGTWCYSSPELIADPKCSYPADVWSAMLLFVVMMTGEAPWHSSIEKAVSSERSRYLEGTILITSYFEKKHYLKLVNESLYRERLQAEFENAPEYARQLDILDQLAALAREVFVRDPSQRPSADDLLNSLVMIRASTW